MITIERYRAVTGDTTTGASAVSALVEEAVELLVEELQRPINATERTEWVEVDREGRAYPEVTPITEVEQGWEIDGDTLIRPPLASFTPSSYGAGRAQVTYTAGWTLETLPTHMRRDIAWAAYALGHPSQLAAGMPAGATGIMLGDVQVQFGVQGKTPGSVRSATDLAIKWSRNTLLWRRR